jgi:indolepyruvate decarboxylase
MASVAEFLIERLENAGIKHVLGLPGDYILDFFSKLAESKRIDLVNCADEAGAGFAADGYARLNGIGCVAVTYNVGALKICNSIAGAFAERSPVVVISGAPGLNERDGIPFDCQREVFKNITCDQAVLDNPTTAGYEIDHAFESLKYHKQPIYIELPRDVVSKPIGYDVYTQGTPKAPITDLQNLEDALREVTAWIEDSKNPVILAGVEIARYQLGKELVKFCEKYNIPVACTLLSKSTINEIHPLYIGVYAGQSSSHQHVRGMVENSDCLLVLGEIITEATVGYRQSKAFQKRDMVICTVNELKVRNHLFPQVSFTDFCRTLFKTSLTKKGMPLLPSKQEVLPFQVRDDKLTTARLFEKINSMMDEDTVVIADIGDSLLGASDLMVHYHDTFLGPAFYLSMGFAIPASLGVKLAKPKCRPIVIVGDGAFQMSCSEVSTMLRWKQNPIIFILNNRGYTTERVLMDGRFNNIGDWNYHLITQLMGGGTGTRVTTEQELEHATSEAIRSEEVSILNCIVDQLDTSPALKRIIDTRKAK